MTALKERYVTAVEYLAMDRDSEQRLELHDGVVVPIEAATRAHGLIMSNLIREVGNRLKGKNCEVYPNVIRVASTTGRLYFYPDVVVACGEPQFEDRRGDTLLDATVIFEVLSKTTELRDRKIKFESYQALPSLQQYLLVDQYRPHIEVYDRNENGTWTYSVLKGIEAVLSLPRIGCSLPLSEIYERVIFPPQDDEADE